MARVLSPENFHVRIWPEDPRGTLYLSAKPVTEEYKYRRACEDIVTAVKRHIDGIAGVSMSYDPNPVCEHCGSKWTEESRTYNGGCCDEDEASNSTAQGIVTEGGDASAAPVSASELEPGREAMRTPSPSTPSPQEP